MSYFTKPNFIVFNKIFDNDFKTKINLKSKKIKNIATLAEFFFLENRITKLESLKVTCK